MLLISACGSAEAAAELPSRDAQDPRPAGAPTAEEVPTDAGIDPWLAIGGIVVTGALAPWLTGVVQRRADRQRFQQDRAAVRRDDLRSLLDRAAELLAPGVTNLRELSEAQDEEAHTQLKSWMKEAFTMGERLRLRLPADHVVVSAYDGVREAMAAVSELQPSSDDYVSGVSRFEEARAEFLEQGRKELAADVLPAKRAQ